MDTDSDTTTETSSTAQDVESDGSAARFHAQQSLQMQHRQTQKRRSKAACYAITALLLAGCAADLATTWVAPQTGRLAVHWNATRQNNCTYEDALDCTRVMNEFECSNICAFNQNNYTTRLDRNSGIISGQENCYSLENCPENAQMRLLLGIAAVTTRIVTCMLPAWLYCANN
jgi:hypothetical protein